VDPEAAQLVFSNFELAAKTTLIPLDVTHQVLASKEVQNLLLRGRNFEESETMDKPEKPSTLRTMFVELLNFFSHSYATVFGITEGPPLHDPLAKSHFMIISRGMKAEKRGMRSQLLLREVTSRR
jgi:uridine nucleosidase